MNTLEKIEQLGVMPVIVIDDAQDAPALAEALLAGGVYAAEITMRTAAGREAIALIAQSYPDMIVGAGTVLTAEAAIAAIDAGSSFIVSPGFNPAVAEICEQNDIPYLPGVVTPTEIDMALSHGINWLKFFPAESFGGAKTIKALSAPYTDVKFMPTGGITLDNIADYLKLPCIYCCGASFIAERALIKDHNFSEITRRCAGAVELVKQIRG